MPTYKFEAMDTAGEEVKDEIEATSEEEAQQKIKQMGYFVTKLTAMGGGKQMVKKNKAGIGYVGQAWLKSSIKALKLNGTAITTKNVKSNKYVLSRYLYWVVPESNVNPQVAKFIDWSRKSYEARRVIEKIGGVAIFNAKKKKKARTAAIAQTLFGNN